MSYSYAVEQAIRAASILHKDQVRKGIVPYPYITHLFAVAMIVSDYTDDENTIVAALLHDTLDHTDYSEGELTEDFGGPVCDIVAPLSRISIHDAKKDPESLKQYAKEIKQAVEGTRIILAASIIHDMRSIIEDYFDDHSGFIAEHGSNVESEIFLYEEIHAVLNRTLKNDILAEFNNVFTEYKHFLNEVERKQNEF